MKKVLCPECGEDLAKGSLVAHCQTQYGMAKGGSIQEGENEDRVNNPRTFRMEFPAKAVPMPYPVEGCSGRAMMGTAMWVHFWHRHFQETVVILEEGNTPHPRFPLFDMGHSEVQEGVRVEAKVIGSRGVEGGHL